METLGDSVPGDRVLGEGTLSDGHRGDGSAASRTARGPPCLWFTRLPLRELLECIRARHFRGIARVPRLQFAVQRELAESDDDEGGAQISLHQLLNHAGTPAEVFGTLFKRSLWRTTWRRSSLSAEPGGPGFFTICPEEPFAEAWLDHNLGRCLRRPIDELHEAEVTSRWRPLWLAARESTPVLSLKRALAETELLKLLRQLG